MRLNPILQQRLRAMQQKIGQAILKEQQRQDAREKAQAEVLKKAQEKLRTNLQRLFGRR